MCRNASRLAGAVAIVILAACDSADPAGWTGTEVAANGSPVTLMECTSGDTDAALGVIGPLGGLLELGGHRVDVPVGSVLKPTLFTISTPASQHMVVDVSAYGLPEFWFHRPIKVTIDYSRCDKDAMPSGVWYIDHDTGELLENMGGVNDPVRRRITFTTSHLSAYALAD